MDPGEPSLGETRRERPRNHEHPGSEAFLGAGGQSVIPHREEGCVPLELRLGFALVIVDRSVRAPYHPALERVMDKALIDRVLKLEPAERMRLVNAIYGSLERPDAAIDEIWYDEAERRLEAYKAGRIKGIPGEQVLGERP
jgi:putative addiction module component (TIGR02574 family)